MMFYNGYSIDGLASIIVHELMHYNEMFNKKNNGVENYDCVPSYYSAIVGITKDYSYDTIEYMFAESLYLSISQETKAFTSQIYQEIKDKMRDRGIEKPTNEELKDMLENCIQYNRYKIVLTDYLPILKNLQYRDVRKIVNALKMKGYRCGERFVYNKIDDIERAITKAFKKMNNNAMLVFNESKESDDNKSLCIALTEIMKNKRNTIDNVFSEALFYSLPQTVSIISERVLSDMNILKADKMIINPSNLQVKNSVLNYEPFMKYCSIKESYTKRLNKLSDKDINRIIESFMQYGLHLDENKISDMIKESENRIDEALRRICNKSIKVLKESVVGEDSFVDYKYDTFNDLIKETKHNGLNETICESIIDKELHSFNGQYKLSEELETVVYYMIQNNIKEYDYRIRLNNDLISNVKLVLSVWEGSALRGEIKNYEIDNHSCLIEVHLTRQQCNDVRNGYIINNLKSVLAHELMHFNEMSKRKSNDVDDYIGVPMYYESLKNILNNYVFDSVEYEFAEALYLTSFQEINAFVSQTFQEIKELMYVNDIEKPTNEQIKDYIMNSEPYARYNNILTNYIPKFKCMNDSEIKKIVLAFRYNGFSECRKKFIVDSIRNIENITKKALRKIAKNAMLVFKDVKVQENVFGGFKYNID